MIQLMIAFCLAVFWSGVYAVGCNFIPWLPIRLIDVVFVAVGGFGFMGLAITRSAGRREDGKH